MEILEAMETETSDEKKDSKDDEESEKNSQPPSNKAETPSSENNPENPEPAVPEEEKIAWPTANDLNTRLRRVITMYQRSVNSKKPMMDDHKTNANFNSKSKGVNAEIEIVNHQTNAQNAIESMNMQGWDLQKLAMYLLVRTISLFFFKLHKKIWMI